MLEPDDDTVQELIRAVVAAGSIPDPSDLDAVNAFFNDQVIDGHDNFPAPNGLYVSVTRMRPSTALGPGQRLYSGIAGDAAQRLNAETSREVAGEWSVQWHGYIDEYGAPDGPNPFDYANRFWFWCHGADGLSKMLLHGLTFVRCSEPRDLSFVTADSVWERRAGSDFKVSYRQRFTSVVPSIGQIPFGVSSDLLPGDSLVIGSDGSVSIE